MSSLTNTHVISYNGYSFPAETETVGLDIESVYQSNGMHIDHYRYTLTLRFVVSSTSAANQNSAISNIRNLLLQPAKSLIYSYSFGSLTVNAGGAIDVDFGPKPVSFRFKPNGSGLSSEIYWTVQFALPRCGEGDTNTNTIREFSFYQTNMSDYAGYGSIVRRVYLRVAGNRIAAGRLTADVVADRITVAYPVNYRVDDITRDISPDKTEITITYKFSQIPQPLPPGVVKCEASITHSTAKDFNFAQWEGRIQARYEMSALWSRATAFRYFYDMAMRKIRDEIASSPRLALTFGFTEKNKEKPVEVMVRSVSMSNPDIYGRNVAEFTMNYIVTTSLQALLVEGLWTPVPGTNFTSWKRSLQNNVFHPRGLTGFYDPYVAVVSTLCDPVPRSPGAITSIPGRPVEAGPGIKESSMTTAPKPGTSWIMYQSHVKLEKDSRKVIHAPINSPSGTSTLSSASKGDVMDRLKGAAGNLNKVTEYKPDQSGPVGQDRVVVQSVGPEIWYVRLYGVAKRAGYPISPPVLKSYAGRQATEVTDRSRGEGFETWISGATGVPIYSAKWNLVYVLDGPPLGAVVAATPFHPSR